MLYGVHYNKDTYSGALAGNVRRLRVMRGLSQTELAHAAGLSRSTIAAIELGKYKSTDLTTIDSLATCLGVTSEQLRAPSPESMPMSPLIQAFISSPWKESLQPSQHEIEWLKSLPDITWIGAKPTPDTVAKILMWRRDTRRPSD